MIVNKTTAKITKVSKTSPKNSLETVTNGEEHIKLIKEYISPEKRQKIIEDLRLT